MNQDHFSETQQPPINFETVTRISDLQKKEDERHEKHLTVLKAQGPDAAKPGATATGAPTTGAVKAPPAKVDAPKTDATQKKESL